MIATQKIGWRSRSGVVTLFTAALAVSAMSASHAQCVSSQYGTFTQGNYFVQNDEWGLSNGGSGWEQVCSGSSSSNSWSSQWNWPSGATNIRAYPSIVRGWQYGTWSPNRGGFPVQVAAQAGLPTSVNYSMSGSNRYDTAYDLFFSPSTNPGSPSAELMVWLSYSNTQPAGSKVSSGVTLGGVSGTWDVWSGNVGWPVWSFVRTQQTNSFSGKLQPFVYYVAYSNHWLNTSWYELNIEFGTEIITSYGANGGLNVSNYSASAY